jgi:formate hydrogenlyase transcriptional activator
LKKVFEQVRKVAPTDSTVLLLGETGTGKELIARSIHEQSGRVSRTFVKINCSAIPAGLLESELFGHERGAFTGALSQRFGRFEIADGGTLFLDEVGDIPLEVQPKLLRVLQEREFERLGNSRTIRTNVRVIAATNRDLSEMVSKREFRADLFYRLNVFPVRLPSLRERREDIPRLVQYFTQRYSSRMNRQITTVPNETLRALGEWSWPGNIREMENFIERSVILSTGPVLEAPLSELSSVSSPASTLDESERQLIV